MATRDEGALFVVSPSTRRVTVPQTNRVIGTVGDHLSELITFQLPRTLDGHDTTRCGRKYISWKNVNGETGTDELKVKSNDETSTLMAWLITNGLTVGKGLVSFSLHFEEWADDQLTYRWSTATCSECEILDAINSVLGAYKNLYVDGGTLVIADFTPVEDSTLALDSPGFKPEGTLTIEENGVHDVYNFAHVVVAVQTPEQPDEVVLETPVIKVLSDGTVTATANGKVAEHKITDADAPTLVPEYIAKGVNILGVVGTRGGYDFDGKYYTVPVRIVNSTLGDIDLSFVRLTSDAIQLYTDNIPRAADTIYPLLNDTSVVIYLASGNEALKDPDNKDNYLNLRVWAYNWDEASETHGFEDLSSMITHSDPCSVRLMMNENEFKKHFIGDVNGVYWLWVCYGDQYLPPMGS